MAEKQSENPLMNFVKTVKNYFVGSPDEGTFYANESNSKLQGTKS